MKLRAIFHFAASAALLTACATTISPVAAAQDLRQDLKQFVETPAIPGYEQVLGKEIQKDLAKWKPQIDSIGNVVVTIGSGAPHRVIVTPMDEPGYIVSSITPDGYLRVQRLPQAAPNPIFDSLYSAEPVYIRTRSGKNVTGIVAGLSTHLQSARPAPAPADLHEGMYSLDDIYVDVGATSAAEVRQAGVEILDPISIERHLYEMGYGRMTAPCDWRPLWLRRSGGNASASGCCESSRNFDGRIRRSTVGRRPRHRAHPREVGHTERLMK